MHGSPSLPETDAIVDGVYKKTIAETLMDPNNDSVSEEYKNEANEMFTTTFTRESWGLGCVALKMINLPPAGGEFIMVNASCPVDNKHSILRWTMRVSKDIEDEVGMAIIDGIANGVLDDMPIWDNKSYVANPILCDGDGPINKFRKWVSQFYSEINPIYKPAREGELNRSVLNSSKAKKELDWKPEYNLDDGMKQVLNWLKA